MTKTKRHDCKKKKRVSLPSISNNAALPNDTNADSVSHNDKHQRLSLPFVSNNHDKPQPPASSSNATLHDDALSNSTDESDDGDASRYRIEFKEIEEEYISPKSPDQKPKTTESKRFGLATTPAFEKKRKRHCKKTYMDKIVSHPAISHRHDEHQPLSNIAKNNGKKKKRHQKKNDLDKLVSPPSISSHEMDSNTHQPPSNAGHDEKNAGISSAITNGDSGLDVNPNAALLNDTNANLVSNNNEHQRVSLPSIFEHHQPQPPSNAAAMHNNTNADLVSDNNTQQRVFDNHHEPKPHASNAALHNDTNDDALPNLTGDSDNGGVSRYRTVFQEIEQIGRGNYFCSVFKVLKRIDGCLYAVKRTGKFYHHNGRLKAAFQLLAFSSLGSHENIVGYHCGWFENDQLYIQLELCDHNLSMKNCTASFTVEQALEALYQVANAVRFLHEKGAEHLDIKPANIYVKNGVYKLGDFVCSTHPEEEDAHYLPPEFVDDNDDHLDKVDIFSLGASFYELTRQLPLLESGCQISNPKMGLPLLQDQSLQLHNLLKVMMHPDPIKRPSARELIENPIFERLRKATKH